MKLEQAQPPLVFAARQARLLSSFPQSPDQLWAADLKACRSGLWCEVFEDVLFVESGGLAYIYGMEFEDGYPQGLEAARARRQQAFIGFLRAQTRQRNEFFGALAALFSGHEYSAEGKATAAYIAARGVSLNMGVGYRDAGGLYRLVALDPEEDGWLEAARSTLSFDDLG